MPKLPLVLALLSLFGASCKKNGPAGTNDGGASASSAPPPVVISAAATPEEKDGGLGKRPTTTSWSIAGGNLDADIAERLKKNPPQPSQQLYLVELFLERGQILANVADFEAADERSALFLKGNPGEPHALFARALALGAFHKFDDELKLLDQVPLKDLDVGRRVSGVRAGVLSALGRYDEALKLMPPADDEKTPIGIAGAAALAGKMQKNDESERLFEKARASLVDVSPFPLAWMDFQRGLLLEARGKESQARLYYAEACAAIPVFAHAAVHLAATDTPAEAITRLEALRKVSTDPDVLAALADAYRKAKKDADATKTTEEARKRYEELIAKHPEAYRDHAARFWLGAGNDPKKALDFAEKNAALRPTEEAIDLWMGAAAAANQKDAVCKSAAAMGKLTYVSESRKRLAAAASNGCPADPKK